MPWELIIVMGRLIIVRATSFTKVFVLLVLLILPILLSACCLNKENQIAPRLTVECTLDTSELENLYSGTTTEVILVGTGFGKAYLKVDEIGKFLSNQTLAVYQWDVEKNELTSLLECSDDLICVKDLAVMGDEVLISAVKCETEISDKTEFMVFKVEGGRIEILKQGECESHIFAPRMRASTLGCYVWYKKPSNETDDASVELNLLGREWKNLITVEGTIPFNMTINPGTKDLLFSIYESDTKTISLNIVEGETIKLLDEVEPTHFVSAHMLEDLMLICNRKLRSDGECDYYVFFQDFESKQRFLISNWSSDEEVIYVKEVREKEYLLVSKEQYTGACKYWWLSYQRDTNKVKYNFIEVKSIDILSTSLTHYFLDSKSGEGLEFFAQDRFNKNVYFVVLNTK